MAEKKTITKRQFDAATKKHPANNWIKFAFKYFSSSTEKEDMNLKNGYVFTLLGLFFLGFFGTVFKASHAFIGIVTIAYVILLAILVFYLLSAIMLNNKRLKKVIKILGISKSEYNSLVRKFYS